VDVGESRDGLFSLPVIVPAGARPGFYPAIISGIFQSRDGSSTEFAPGARGGVTVVPEPSGATPAALAAFLLLRRRSARSAARHDQDEP
jgi:hypothetical protein